MSQSIAILMTTYNGEAYVAEQINSICEQTVKDWRLYIRDDGSSDRTLSIIKKIANLDRRIKVVSDNLGNLGVKAGFMQLLKASSAQFYFFSDQDDVWLPEKIEITLNKFQGYNSQIPVLVHTNLTTVDEHLHTLSKNFYPKSGLDKINILLSSNSVTGCTVAINDTLKWRVMDDPVELMVMHDWWMALCASTTGKIQYVSKPTILYRQHSTNQVGTDTSWLVKLRRLTNYDDEIERLKASFRQARGLLSRHSSEMSPVVRNKISDYSTLLQKRGFNRIRTMFRQKFRKRSLLGTVSLWYIISFHPNK